MQFQILVDRRSQGLYDNIVEQLQNKPDISIVPVLCDLEIGDLNLILIDNRGNLKGKVIFDRRTLSDTVVGIINSNINIDANLCNIQKNFVYGISTDTNIQSVSVGGFNSRLTTYTNECLTNKYPTRYMFINDSMGISAGAEHLSRIFCSYIDTAFSSTVRQLMFTDVCASADFILRYCKSIYTPQYNIFGKKSMRTAKYEAEFASKYNYKYINDNGLREKITAVIY